MGWDRSDTLEHCIICVSFVFCMNPILTLAFTRRIAIVCAFEIHFFLCSADYQGSTTYTMVQRSEFGIKAPITSAETR